MLTIQMDVRSSTRLALKNKHLLEVLRIKRSLPTLLIAQHPMRFLISL